MHLYLMQSSQKRLAENFLFTTTVRPWIRHWPTPMILPDMNRTVTLSYTNLDSQTICICRRSLSHTSWVIEREAVIDDIIRAHAKGKIPKSSNSVVTTTKQKQKRFSDICHCSSCGWWFFCEGLFKKTYRLWTTIAALGIPVVPEV